MAAITRTVISSPKPGGAVYKTYGTSTANQADTLTTTTVPVGATWRLLYTTVKYSAAPTQTGVTVEIVDSVGTTYDTTVATHTANGQNNYFIPDEETRLVTGDAIRVNVPAGGVGITAAIKIVVEQN